MIYKFDMSDFKKHRRRQQRARIPFQLILRDSVGISTVPNTSTWEVFLFKCLWQQPFSRIQYNGVMSTEYCTYFKVCHWVFDCFLHFLATASHARPWRPSGSWFWKSNAWLPQPLRAAGVCSISQPVFEAHIRHTTQCCRDRKMRKTHRLHRGKRTKRSFMTGELRWTEHFCQAQLGTFFILAGGGGCFYVIW